MGQWPSAYLLKPKGLTWGNLVAPQTYGSSLGPEPRGMGGGRGPLQSGSSPSIFLEGAEELVAMETGKRQGDAGRYWGQAEIHTFDPSGHIYSHHTRFSSKCTLELKMGRAVSMPLSSSQFTD